MKTIVASGFFDPLHSGHLEYLSKAKDLGDYLIVLVNSNEAAQRKKGFYFMDQAERMKIIQSLKFVDEVLLAIDHDGTVATSLQQIKPAIFAKGGDRTIDNLPIEEITVCQTCHIEIVTGLGHKIQSSSNLINNYRHNHAVCSD